MKKLLILFLFLLVVVGCNLFKVTLEPPEDLTAEGSSLSSIELQWDHGDYEADEQVIEMKQSGGSYSKIAEVEWLTESFTVTELSPLTVYCFRVKATSSNGSSPYSNEASASTFNPVPFDLSSIGPREEYSAFNSGDIVINTGEGFGIYADDSRCLDGATFVSSSGGEYTINWDMYYDVNCYGSFPYMTCFTHGGWISYRREVTEIADISLYTGLEIELAVSQPASGDMRLRITLCDVESPEDINDHGSDELWWYDFDETFLETASDFTTYEIPFSEFRLAYGDGTRRNNRELDKNNIVAIEFNILAYSVTDSDTGVILVRNMKTYSE